MNSLSPGRETFIDSARGISIILVVVWHKFDEGLFFNGPLVFLRMPLFFFMAGIFAKSILTAPVARVLSDKIGQLLWIFVLWAPILYLTGSGLEQMVKHGTLDLGPIYSMFWRPPSTIWFIYALAIAYFTVLISRQLPHLPVLTAAFALYIWAATSGGWANPPFNIKVLRLLPASMLAVFYSAEILSFAKRYDHTWPIHALIFFPSAYFVYYSNLSLIGPVTATVSMLGIFFILTACHRYRNTCGLKLAAVVGERSIYIFLMHRIILSYGKEFATLLHVEQYLATQIAVLVLSIVLPATLGMFIVDRYMPWLIAAPWLSRKKVAQPVIPLT
jgi:uncharacterized membrane protein YcfT